MRKGTFSGIEVLIVLAVIGFLVVLCIPIFEVTYKVRKYTKFKNSFSGVDRDSLERMDEKNRPLIQGYVNKKMTELAKKYFDANEQALKYQIGDGRVSLKKIKGNFEIIIIDAYTQQHYLPPHLVTEEFFSLVQEKLDSEGILIANVNARSTNSPLFKAITTTLGQVFSQVRFVPIPDTYNYLIFASNKRDFFSNLKTPKKFNNFFEVMKNNQEVESKGTILTDNHSPVEWLTDQDIFSEYFSR